VPEDDRLVTVARCDSEGDAQLAKAQLEDAGIPCMLANAEQAGLAMMFDASRSGVQVKVPADQVEEARTLLAAEDD
jgi:flagellar biosynthesis/type III secretory pathway M-ring protein FliF/YscJ